MSELKKIGAVISLDGEKDYRQALKDIKSDQKLLRSEMELAKAQYDLNGDSVEGLKKKQELLDKEIDIQKGKVDILKEAVEKSKEQYGENSTKTEEWKTQLNYAKADLENMNSELQTNKEKLENAEKATEDTGTAVDDLGTDLDETKEKSEGFAEKLSTNLTLTDVINGLKTAAGLAKKAWDEVYAIARDSAAYADDILTISTNTGIATDTLQELKYAEPLIDVPLSTITDSMKKVTTALSGARDGSDKYKTAFEQLGISVTNQDGTLRDSETVFWEIIGALGNMKDGTDKDALAMQLLGKQANSLNGLIKTGKDGIKNFADEAHAMGAVLDKDALNKLGNLDDSFENLHSAMVSLRNNAAVLFAPALTLVLNAITALFGGAAKLLSGHKDAITEHIDDVNKKSEELKTSIDNSVKAFEEQKSNIEGNSEYVKQLTDNIFALAGQTSLTAEEQQLLKVELAEINALIPDLNLQYDTQTGTLNKTRDEVDKLTKAYHDQAVEMAYQDQWTQLTNAHIEAVKNQVEAEKALNEVMGLEGGSKVIKEYNEQLEKHKQWLVESTGAASEAELSQEELNTLMDQAAEYAKQELFNMQNVGDYSANEYVEKLNSAKEAQETANEEVTHAQTALSDLQTEIDEVKAAYDLNIETTEESTEATEAATEATEANTEAAEELATQAEETAEELSELDKAIQTYAESSGTSAEDVKKNFETMRDAFVDAYKEAETSINGQIGLFKDLKTEATATDQEMLDNLLNQNVTLEQWSNDIQALAKAGLEDGLLQQLIDAGPAGAADVQQLAKHIGDETDTFIEDMNTAYREQMKIKEAFATEMAESETNFLSYSDQIGVDAETLRSELAAKGVEIGSDYSSSMAGSIGEGAPDVVSETEDIAKDTADKAEKFEKAGVDSAERYVKKVKKILEDSQPGIAIKLGDVAKLFKVNGDTIEKRGTENGQKYVDAIKVELQKTQGIQDELDRIERLARGKATPMYSAGESLGDGVINGLKAALSRRYWEVDQAVEQINARARQAMKIQSPSKVMMETGSYIGEGLIEGTVKSIDEGLYDVTKETERLSDTLTGGFEDMSRLQLPDLTLGRDSFGNTTNNETTNFGGVNINVYGKDGQSNRELAEYIIEIITDRQQMANRVW